MIVKGTAFCFNCNKIVNTKLRESESRNSSEPTVESLGAEIRDKLAPGSSILLGKCPECKSIVGRFGYDNCQFQEIETADLDGTYAEPDMEKLRKALKRLEENESKIDKELEKRSLTDYWDNKENKFTVFKNKISDIDIFKYRKPDGGIDWDRFHEERRRRKNSTKSTEFSDEDKEELR